MPDMTTQPSSSLKANWETLKAESPHLRIRDAANQLGVSEALLLATDLGQNTIRLEGSWQELLKRFNDLGYVMSLTRNDACVLEHKGAFEDVRIFGSANHQMGIVLGPIETRVFFKNWGFAFANTMDKGDYVMKNIQVFDKSGEAITKIYLQESSNFEAYDELIQEFKAEDQSTELELAPAEEIEYSKEIDHKVFLEEWRNLQDTHDFFPLLGRHKAHRYHALEIAEGEFTHQVSNQAVTTILEEASKTALPIMIFAGNHGNLQIHQSTVHKVLSMIRGGQDWINVMDPEFNLHLRRDMIAHSWVVKKPTKDGVVTSVELFDEKLNMICQLFGLRKPGQQELSEWSALVDKLEKS